MSDREAWERRWPEAASELRNIARSEPKAAPPPLDELRERIAALEGELMVIRPVYEAVLKAGREYPEILAALREGETVQHIGSPSGFAAYPLDQPKPTGGSWDATSHDAGCCASRGCHKVCSHLCGTDLHACDGTAHPALRDEGETT